jgi:hypothetical protein
VHLGYVDQSRDHLDGTKNVWEEISGGLDYMKVNGMTMSDPRLCRRVQLQGAGPAEERRQALGR